MKAVNNMSSFWLKRTSSRLRLLSQFGGEETDLKNGDEFLEGHSLESYLVGEVPDGSVWVLKGWTNGGDLLVVCNLLRVEEVRAANLKCEENIWGNGARQKFGTMLRAVRYNRSRLVVYVDGETLSGYDVVAVVEGCRV